MKVKNLIGRKYDSLSKDEQEYYDDVQEKYELNICDKTNIICYPGELVWGVYGYDAICIEAFEEEQEIKNIINQ